MPWYATIHANGGGWFKLGFNMNFQLIGMFSTSPIPKLQATSSHWPWHWRSVARTKLDETSQSAKMWKVGTVLYDTGLDDILVQSSYAI